MRLTVPGPAAGQRDLLTNLAQYALERRVAERAAGLGGDRLVDNVVDISSCCRAPAGPCATCEAGFCGMLSAHYAYD